MDITETRVADGYCLKVTRSLDRTSVMDLEKALRLLWERHEGPVYVDIGELQSIDSAGLTVFLQWHRKALGANRKFALIEPGGFHLKLMEITRMDEDLVMLEDVGGAPIKFTEEHRG